MTNDTLAIYLTLIVSLMNAVGFCLQRKGQTLIPAKYSGFKLIIESIKTPLWLVGFLFVVGKMPLYIYSISIGDLSVVQPINATAILFIVIIGIFWLKETLSKWEITGMVAIVVGTIVIGLFYPVASVTVEIGQLWGSAAIFMVVCAVACVALLVIKQKEISMAFISGITMAIAVILVKLISFSLIGTPFTSVNLLSIDLDKKLLFGIIDPMPIYQTISWMFYGAILAIILSLLTLLFAFRAGKALFVAPIELISSILLPVFAGFWVFSETVNGPLILGILLSLAGALMLSGAQVRVEDAIKQKQPVSAKKIKEEGEYTMKPLVPRPGMAKDHNIIIGAGPAGISAGFELSRHELPCILLEKAAQTGGICKTLEFEYDGEKYLTDIGPHRFFSKNKALYKLIEELLGPDWVEVERLTRQYISGKYYDYPVNVVQAVMNAGPQLAFRMGLDYLKELIRGFVIEADKTTFESWVVANFGRALAEFNMINYTEKIWGIPCNKIAGEWAAQRIPGMNAASIVTKALKIGGGEGPKSMIDAFYYPRRGINMIYAAMEREIQSHGNSTLTEVNITKIRHEDNLVTSLDYEHDGVTETIPVDNLISSMPITELVELFDPAPPEEVLAAAWNLEYRDQVHVFLIVDKPTITKDTWIYFPTTPPTFGRMMEPKNWTVDMAPPNRSSLFVEYFAFKGDKLWNMPEEMLVQMTVKQLAWMGYLKPEEVLDSHVVYVEKAYPSWDIYFRRRLEKINAYLVQFPNVYTVGRNGRFRYNNQDHSIETGLLAAKSIFEEQNYDLEAVGADLEYFESGTLYDQQAEKAAEKSKQKGKQKAGPLT